MPNYYNPNLWSGIYPNYTTMQPYGYNSGNLPSVNPSQQYMINVDGEMAAKAWQIPGNIGPNMIIPLWDLDGEHIYFKTTDAYGRMNPIRKGRIVFEDVQKNLSNGESQAPSASPPDMSQFVTKNDLDILKTEIRNMLQTNQNGSENRPNNRQNNGGNRG